MVGTLTRWLIDRSTKQVMKKGGEKGINEADKGALQQWSTCSEPQGRKVERQTEEGRW